MFGSEYALKCLTRRKEIHSSLLISLVWRGRLIDGGDLPMQVDGDAEAKHTQHIAGLQRDTLGNNLIHVYVS